MKLDEVPFVGGFFSFFPGWGCFRKGGLIHPTIVRFGVPSNEVG
jgi:hypothetical protein